VRIPLGRPLSPEGEPVAEADIARRGTVVESEGARLSVFPLRVGRPYAVSFLESARSPSASSLLERGVRGKNPGLSPLAVRIVSRDEIRILGPSASLVDSCSAAAAAHAVCVSAGFCERAAAAVFRAGTVYVNWDEASGALSVAASAEYVFEGEYWYSA
jgi:hypothetical protein